MNRYFLEVSYIGTNYAGFQKQRNAGTIQWEIEKALDIILKRAVSLTGSSRTDAGVHAIQNYFHFDSDETINPAIVYNVNSILPDDIAVNKLLMVSQESHCRFDAIAREYVYQIYWFKNPFLSNRAFYYPYKLDLDRLNEAAGILFHYNDYSAFSKRRTQVRTYACTILESSWRIADEKLLYTVKANRFLRGMVRGLVGTMLQIGKGKLQVMELRKILEENDSTLVDFSVPAKGLFLKRVEFPEGYFQNIF
jgi:tRNA pseudouridine38-40 synthase